jgi:glutathionyl-hydroquinone reductase
MEPERCSSTADGPRIGSPYLGRQRGTIVNNESADILRMFNSGFGNLAGNRLDLYPQDLRAEMTR